MSRDIACRGAHGAVRRVLDVESALQWSADELAKRAPSALSQLRGGSIDVPLGFYDGGRPRGFPAVAPGFSIIGGGGMDIARSRPIGLPHPDALAVETAIKGLAGLAFTAADERLDAGMEGFAHDVDAEIAKAARAVCGSVSRHARLGTRPALRPGGPVGQKVVGANGKPIVVRIACGETVDGIWREQDGGAVEAEQPSPPVRAGQYRSGSYCKIAYNPPPQFFVLDRAEYAVWWQALDHLAATLVLDSILVTASTAPRRPWLGDRADAPRVLADERPPAAARSPKKALDMRLRAS